MNNNVLVSIGVITYNQENYIKEALDSILMQKTNFKFEILINDDCSTDKTAEIIKEYEKKYPDIIKPIYQTENQFSKGKGIIKNFIYPRVKSKYFILNEGDDYFLDPYKLQKQVDFLESHPECSICFHPVKVFFQNGKYKSYCFPKHKKQFTFEHLLKSNFIQTNSAMYRWDKNIAQDFPEQILPGDWYMHLYFAKRGKIGYIDEIMSAYRRHEEGIWWDKGGENNRTLKYGKEIINFYYNVYKQIADSSEKYLAKKVLPEFKYVIDMYYQNAKFDNLKLIYEKYPNLFKQAMNSKNQTEKKYLKYKKLFNQMIMVLSLSWIILLSLLVVFIINF